LEIDRAAAGGVWRASRGGPRLAQAVPLRSIQILRAVAACLVVFGHCLHEAGTIAGQTGRPPLSFSIIDWGVGVDIFFVISGFIMIYMTVDLFGHQARRACFSCGASSASCRFIG
jgi:Acyltransferase family